MFRVFRVLVFQLPWISLCLLVLGIRPAREFRSDHQPKGEVEWLSGNKISCEAQKREDFIVQMISLMPFELKDSYWHCFLARLLLSVHNDCHLFVQIQLPYITQEARKSSTTARFTSEIACEESSASAHPKDIWDSTRRFVALSLRHQDAKEEDIDLVLEQLRERTKALVNVAPELWKLIFIREDRGQKLQKISKRLEKLKAELKRTGRAERSERIARDDDVSLAKFMKSVLAALLAGYPQLQADQAEEDVEGGNLKESRIPSALLSESQVEKALQSLLSLKHLPPKENFG